MSNAEEARRLVARAHTRPRSRLSTIPIVKVGDEYRAGALPIEWKDDLEPATRIVKPPVDKDAPPPFWFEIDEEGTHRKEAPKKRVRKAKPELVTLAYIDELEANIEKAGGIENVMVIPDGTDPDKEMRRLQQRAEADRLRQIYQRWFGWDV